MHLCKQVICNDLPAAEFDSAMKCHQAALFTNQFFNKNNQFNALFTTNLDKKPGRRKEVMHYFFKTKF